MPGDTVALASSADSPPSDAEAGKWGAKGGGAEVDSAKGTKVKQARKKERLYRVHAGLSKVRAVCCGCVPCAVHFAS